MIMKKVDYMKSVKRVPKKRHPRIPTFTEMIEGLRIDMSQDIRIKRM